MARAPLAGLHDENNKTESKMEIPNKLLLDIYDSAQHCGVNEYNEYALRTLKKVLHFDSAAVVDFSVTEEQKLVIQGLHLHAAPLERLLDRPKTVGTEMLDKSGAVRSRDKILTKALARRGKSVVVDIAESFSDPTILRYCRKYDTAHSLTFIAGQTPAGSIPAVALWRATRKNAYTDAHGAAADLLLPHLLHGNQINKRLALSSSSKPVGRSVAFATPDGVLYLVEPEVIRLLQREWSQWTPPFLPSVLMDALRQDREMVYAGRAISVRASLQAHAICLVITAHERETPALTRAEQRVASLAAQGLQYKEIAQLLDVSPATIRNQLHSAYSKLGVSNKTSLAGVLQSLRQST